MESRKILIVEDEFITASDVAATLKKEGYTVTGIARTGEKAIKMARENPPDLVLMDIKLGSSMDGIETAQRLRESTGVPIVYLTAHSDREFLERAKATEPYGYLVKPYNPGQVSASLEMALLKASIEKRLAESEAQYCAVVEDQTEMICRFTPDCTLTFVNGAYARYWGQTPKDMVGANFLDFVPESERETGMAHLRSFSPSEPIKMMEHEVVGTDGTARWQQWSDRAFFNDKGEVIGFQSVGRDITDRVKAERALRESEERYRFLADNMSDMVWIIGPDLRTTYVSPSIEKVLGFTQEERNQQSIAEAVTPESLRRIQEGLREELQREGEPGVDLDRSVVIEVEYLHKDGSTVWMENRVQAIRDSESRITGMFGVSRDISERKRAEAERDALEAQNRQIQKEESLGRMAGAIAHHFNNQLQAVTGNLELAMEALAPGSQLTRFLDQAAKATRKAGEVSKLMLTYLGQTPAERKTLDLSEVCRRALPMLEAAMPKNMNLKTDLAEPGPCIRANANQIQQVLANLLTNGWEAMEGTGGTIHLSVATKAAVDIPETHRFPVAWQPNDKVYACLEVRDCGPGMEEQDMERIFDPFFSTKFTGRGLGLPVTLGIVRAHDGVITVETLQGTGNSALESRDGPAPGARASLGEKTVGTLLRVFLPLCEEEMVRQTDKAIKPPEVKGWGTVLVIEDEPQLRDVAASMFSHMGFTALQARDGVEGVEMYRKHGEDIRLVLCDLTMPRMDGWKTLAALRQLHPHVPVILTSGYDEASVVAGDHAELPQAFLGKPFGLQALRKVIARMLGEASPIGKT